MWGQKKQVKKDFPRAIIFLILGTIQAQGLYFNSNPNNLELLHEAPSYFKSKFSFMLRKWRVDRKSL